MKLKYYVPKRDDKGNVNDALKSVSYYEIDGWDVFEYFKLGDSKNYENRPDLARLIEESDLFEKVLKEELVLII